MKSSILFVLLFICTSTILQSEEIIVAYNRNYYPFEFINDEGIPDGFAIDLIYALARESALSVKLVEGNWKFRDEEIFQGVIDFSPGYLQKSENSSIINSKTLFTVPFSLFHRRDITISDFKRLVNNTIVLSSGDSSIPVLLEKYQFDSIIRTKSWSDSFKALLIGYGEYTIVTKVHSELMSQSAREELEELHNFTLEISYGFYSARWNGNTLEKINNSISIIKASGEYDRIFKKWFGDSENLILKRSNSNRRTNMYFVGTVLLITIYIFYMKKRKVKK